MARPNSYASVFKVSPPLWPIAITSLIVRSTSPHKDALGCHRDAKNHFTWKFLKRFKNALNLSLETASSHRKTARHGDGIAPELSIVVQRFGEVAPVLLSAFTADCRRSLVCSRICTAKGAERRNSIKPAASWPIAVSFPIHMLLGSGCARSISGRFLNHSQIHALSALDYSGDPLMSRIFLSGRRHGDHVSQFPGAMTPRSLFTP
jgi:hypothetical protein